MQQKQRHKRRNKKNRNLFFEVFFNERLFLVLGVLLLITGLCYSLASSDLLEKINEILIILFKPSADKAIEAIEFSGQGLTTLLLYFLPAGFFLLISGLDVIIIQIFWKLLLS